jgi:hypothetical protein
MRVPCDCLHPMYRLALTRKFPFTSYTCKTPVQCLGPFFRLDLTSNTCREVCFPNQMQFASFNNPGGSMVRARVSWCVSESV